MPASDRVPDPRARPSSTVSAWSSRVWPTSTVAAPSRAADPVKRAVTSSAGSRLGPAVMRRHVDRDTSTGSSPSPVSSTATSTAREAEPGCSPWSTVTPPTRRPSRGASKAAAAARANGVSAATAGDQYQATTHRARTSDVTNRTPDGGNCRCGARRSTATACVSRLSPAAGSPTPASPTGCATPASSTAPAWRSRPWSAGCSATSRPG